MRLPAPGCKPQAKLNPHCISKKPADLGWRRVCPSPSEGKRGAGDVGAPTGAVHYKIFHYGPDFSGIINFSGDTAAPQGAVKID